MSSLAFVFKVILFIIVFITAVNAYSRSCIKEKKGIRSLQSVQNITGGYRTKVCTENAENQSYVIFLNYVNISEQHCNSQSDVGRLHSIVEKSFEVTTHCPEICQEVTFDLIVNGCYLMLGYILNDLSPMTVSAENKFSVYQYIGNSHKLEYFTKKEPTVSMFYDQGDIDIIWNSGSVPITSYSMSVCLISSYSSLSHDFHQCSTLDYCTKLHSYTLQCSKQDSTNFYMKGLKVLVFKHIEIPWRYGFLFGLNTVVFELGKEFDTTRYYRVFNKKAHYLHYYNLTNFNDTNNENATESVSPSSPRISTRTTPTVAKTTATLHVPEIHEHKNKAEGGSPSKAESGGSGVVITCVVMVVLVLVGALVVRALHVRGYLRRLINPLSRYPTDDSNVIVQRLH